MKFNMHYHYEYLWHIPNICELHTTSWHSTVLTILINIFENN